MKSKQSGCGEGLSPQEAAWGRAKTVSDRFVFIPMQRALQVRGGHLKVRGEEWWILDSAPYIPASSKRLGPWPIRSCPASAHCFSVPFPYQPQPLSPDSHQGATAEENHEDDEGLKPIVLHNEEAGFP